MLLYELPAALTIYQFGSLQVLTFLFLPSTATTQWYLNIFYKPGPWVVSKLTAAGWEVWMKACLWCWWPKSSRERLCKMQQQWENLSLPIFKAVWLVSSAVMTVISEHKLVCTAVIFVVSCYAPKSFACLSVAVISSLDLGASVN